MPILFFIVFIDLVGFGLIIPLLPFYGEHMHATPAEVGLLMAAYSCAQFVTAPFWGRISDRIGRRSVLIIGITGAALSYLWLAFADGLWMLFAARAFGGAMAGNISAAFAYVADITGPHNRAKGMGLIGAAFGLGFIFGPVIGGVLAGSDPLNADYQTPALTAAALSATALVLALAMLPESLSKEVRARQAALPRKTRRQALQRALTQPSVILLLVISFLAVFVFAGMETTFAMWSRRQFGWGPEQNGYLFAFVGVISAGVQGGLIGRLAKRFGEGKLIVLGTASLASGMVMIPYAASLSWLLAAMVFVAIGFSLVSPSLNSLISLQVDAEVQGGTMGITRSTTTLARVLGPSWAGAMFYYIGKDWPFLGGAVVMAAVMLLSLRTIRLSRRHPREEAAGEVDTP
jgi:DHA1 family tetracycline resistance protein-like MFS transporter